jgi:hypothetical protein
MHFEVPKSKSLREFGGEYLMIVISIATALGIEHMVQTVHHRHKAEEAAQRMQTELRLTLAEIEKVTAHNKLQIEEATALQKGLLKDIKSKVAGQKAIDNFFESNKGKFNVSLQIPGFKHEAWDVAVADQSASWMSPGDLQRYSGAYADVRDAQQATTVGMSFLTGSTMLKTMSDLEIDASSPQDLYFMLSQLNFSYKQVNSTLEDLRGKLSKSLEASKS